MNEEIKEPETAAQWQNYWTDELTNAKTPAWKKFQKRGEKVDKKFKDERKDEREDEFGALSSNLNLFNSNITILMSMLYGRNPKVEVTRRFADADDDISRVAGLMVTRILNTDIEVAGEDMASVFRNALQDRLLPGLGDARVQYQFDEETTVTPAIIDPETGEELAPEVSETKIKNEWTDILYTHWKDSLWSPARTHAEITWKAVRSYLTPAKLKARFPEVDIKTVSFNSYGPMAKDGTSKDSRRKQAEVWEIWDKDRKKVFWYTEGVDEILDMQDDPLGLDGFFPSPPPMVANVTTSQFLPKSDYDIASDLYVQINELETRIQLLTEACKLVGCYDEAQPEIKRIFNEGVENDLIPVKNWAQFTEKGGIDGSIQWVPIKEVAEVISILTDKQAQKIQQLQQITGMSDVMRGAASARTQQISATADKLETQFGSIRIEALQNEFARWVNDTQSLKVEIIAKHYQPYCIIQQSNILSTPDGKDPALIQAAVQLIKDPEASKWKITVRPETLAIADYAQLKQDRSEFLMGLAQFMQSSAPLLQLSPMALPVLMKLLKWFLAGFRGSSEVEGILDTAITQFEKAPPKQDKPDPAVEKAKAEMELKAKEHEQKMQQNQQEFQAEMAMRQQQMQQEREQFAQQMQQNQQEHALEMRKILAELAAAVQEQKAQFAYNVAEREHDLKTKKEEAAIKIEEKSENEA
jgi:hypothetical protein